MSEEKAIQISDSGLIKMSDAGEAYRFAGAVIKSGLAPNSFKTPEAVMVAWQQGAELGLKPMQALQHIAVINGRPTIYGKATAGIVVNSGQCEIFEEYYENEDTNLTACCKVKRKGIDSIKVAKFSMNDAKRAGLLDKPGDVWKKYPRDMLMYKARARAFGSLFGDVLCGLPIYEDYMEVPEPKRPLTKFTEPVEGDDPLLAEVGIEDESDPQPKTTQKSTETASGAKQTQKTTQSTKKSDKPSESKIELNFGQKKTLIGQMIFQLCENDKQSSRAYLKNLTTFEGDNGTVQGIESVDKIESENQANVLIGKVKPEFIEKFGDNAYLHAETMASTNML